MRRGLTWTLTATLVLSAVALWGGKVPRVVSAIEPRIRDAATPPDPRLSDASTPPTDLASLPSDLPRIAAEPAKRDIFVPYAPPTAAATPVPMPVVAATPPPPQPQAPSITVRFLGSMTNPNGQRVTYLARGDAAVSVSVGAQLEEGYVVSAIAADAVTLTHPGTQTRVTVPISQPAQP
jgi:hypothetical protein